MMKYIQGKDGKMRGSVPTANRAPSPAPEIRIQSSSQTDSKEQIAHSWDKYSEQHSTLPYGPLKETRARLALTMGECHNLAIAVHRETGWPLIAFSPWSEDGPGTTGVLTHVAVLTPDKYVIDGHGATPLNWSEEQGEYEGQVLESEKDLNSWIEQDTSLGSGDWLPLRPDEFTGYVAALMAEYEEVKR